MADIQNDAILDEFAKHYDTEENLFAQTLNEDSDSLNAQFLAQ